ncbi:MAG: type II toxin-antitoxin system PemK/MazF family toxin [Acidimicrobiia bacterium]|nr:type II toxin-antitoxin system PemK/MazF family toxin [Acidimicrobiia bacterium]
MLNSGDVVDLDLGIPAGREAGLHRPAVVVTADRVLEARPAVVHVVPLTSTMRGFRSEVSIEPNRGSGLNRISAAQCQHIRSVSVHRVRGVRGNVGPLVLAQIRETIGYLLSIPA